MCLAGMQQHGSRCGCLIHLLRKYSECAEELLLAAGGMFALNDLHLASKHK